MPERAPTPTPDRKPAWRAACLAYREQRRAGEGHHAAWLASRAALQAVWPLPDKEAGAETVNAIAFASVFHTAWFWFRRGQPLAVLPGVYGFSDTGIGSCADSARDASTRG
jgi:hypothetical protein